MKLDNYACEGQMSLFDLGIWCGKTSPEPSVATKEKTSVASLKKQRESSVKTPLFLDLRGGVGVRQDVSWVMGGLLLGEYMMRSFGECPSVEKESLLSQILEEQPHQKYCLSAKACQGILRRAERRGKELPPLLKETLLRQSASKKEPENQGGARDCSYNMSEQEPCQHSIISQCWDGTQTSPTLTANNAGGSQRMPDKDNFNAVVQSMEVYHCTTEEDKVQTLKARGYKDPQVVAYGLDRASFNQGQNALYDFSVEQELAQPIVARGPGGGY